MNTYRRAFVLIELMIVISVIAIIAAIAIPNLLRARKGANESAAISSLRTLVSTQALFRDTDQDEDDLNDYAESFDELLSVHLIDDVLASGSKNGYCFILVSYSPDSWHAHANPDEPGTTGDRYFFVDETGIIRFSTTEVATAASDPLEGTAPPGVPEEHPSEHGLTGCGAAQGPMTEEQSMQHTETTMDRLGSGLPKGTTTEDALKLLNDPQFLASVQAHLDLNHDQQVDLDELLNTDLLNVAREVRTELFPNVPDGNTLGPDRFIRMWTQWYQKKMQQIYDDDVIRKGSPPIKK